MTVLFRTDTDAIFQSTCLADKDADKDETAGARPSSTAPPKATRLFLFFPIISLIEHLIECEWLPLLMEPGWETNFSPIR